MSNMISPKIPGSALDSAKQTQSIEGVKVDHSKQADESKSGLKSRDDYVRGLTSQDIANTLLGLQNPVTPENRQLVMTMLLHGVELSSDAFEALEHFTKGKKKVFEK